jgi:hypothetical protein
MRNPVVPGATMTLLGGVLIVLGSFLPWLTATAPLVGTMSRNGMEGGDGIITLILGVVTILIGVTQLTATNLPTLLQRSPSSLAPSPGSWRSSTISTSSSALRT